MSKRLIEKLTGKSCNKGKPGGLLNKGGAWWEDFPGDEARKKIEEEKKKE